MQSSSIPVKEEVSDKKPVKMTTKCPTIKTTAIPIKQKIINIRKAVPSVSNVDNSVNNFPKTNFVANWVPDTFSNFVGLFYEKAKTIEEFWKVIKQCNRVVDHSTNERAFTGSQELKIGIKAFKEFAMKVMSGIAMHKGEFAYFNGIVNKLMDKLYFDAEFMD